MSKQEIRLNSDLDSCQILKRLEDVTAPKANFKDTLTRKFLFFGSIKEGRIRLSTYDAPPINIYGTINESDAGSQINLVVKWDSMSRMLKTVSYTLVYPIITAFAIMLLVKMDNKLLALLITIIAFIITYIGIRLYTYLSVVDPNPKSIIEKLKSLLEATDSSS